MVIAASWLLVLAAVSSPTSVGRPDEALVVRGELTADEVVLRGSRIEVTGRVRARTLVIVSSGPVRLHGHIEAETLDERGAALSVAGVLRVGRAHLDNVDRAVRFDADTAISGAIDDVADVIVAPGVVLTLTGDTAITADSDGDGSGSLSMGAGSSISGTAARLTLRTSGTAPLEALDVLGLTLRSSAQSRGRFETHATVSCGDFLLAGAALVLGATFSVSRTFDSSDGWLEASGGRIDFTGAQPQSATIGVDGLGGFRHTGAGTLNVSSKWPRRATVTFEGVDGGLGGETQLFDFPVLVGLQGSHELFGLSAPTGDDLAFTDAYGQRLAHELERFDAAGQHLVAWVKVPFFSLTHPTPLTLHYGNPGARPQADPTAVWNSGYAAVFHFGEADAGRALDSTANRHHASATGTRAAVGRIGLGRDLGGGERLVIDTSASLVLETPTLELFAYPVGLNGPGLGGNRMVDRSWVGNVDHWSWFIWEARSVSFDSMSDAGARFGGSTPVIFALNRWFFAAGRVTNDDAQVWVDGVTAGSTPKPRDAGTFFSTTDTLCISSCYGWDPWVGTLDELRVSSTPRTEGWTQATRRSVESPPQVSGGAAAPFDLPLGHQCSALAPCRSGACVDGLCCERVCGACERCDRGNGGLCTPVVDAGDPDSCMRCDAVGQCVVPLPPDGGDDAGAPDAGVGDVDAGVTTGSELRVHCGCDGQPALAALVLAALVVLRRRGRANAA